MHLNTILKEKKDVSLLILDDISIEEEISKIMYVTPNLHNDKKARKILQDS